MQNLYKRGGANAGSGDATGRGGGCQGAATVEDDSVVLGELALWWSFVELVRGVYIYIYWNLRAAIIYCCTFCWGRGDGEKYNKITYM